MPTGEDKVALLLSSLSPPVVESVLSRMPPEQKDRLRACLKALPPTTPAEVLDEAAKEFLDLFRISERVPNLGTGSGTAAALAAPAAPPPTAEAAKAAASYEKEAAEMTTALQAVLPATLSQALRAERPATVALILGCLEPKETAEVLRLLPAELRAEAALRLARPVNPSRAVVVQVGRAVLARCQTAPEPETTLDDKLLHLANVVRGLGREDRQAILERLEKTDSSAAAVIRKQLYRLADVLRIDDRSLQSILSQLDMKSLAAALKGVSADVTEKILSNVSKRAREAVAEEMELSASLPKAKTEEAQGRILGIMATMDKEGKLNLEPAG